METNTADIELVKKSSHNSSQQSIDTPCPNSPQPNTIIPAQTIDEYELGTAIGFGSTAIVHAGRHLPTNTPVAIKVFDLDRFEQQQIDRLRQELAVMSMCSTHENLLNYSACLTNKNELWLMMPLCSAGSLADVLKWSFPDGFEEAVIASVLLQTVSGLHHLHASGHCHRDIKAANLLLDADGTVKLADFGVSASLDHSGHLTGLNSRRKTFVGTPCWMAPEVMEGGGYDGAKADIWSLGILALELAYGQAPFAKYPPMKVIYLTISAQTPPTLERERCRHKYSKTLKDFIDCCLQRAPEKRPSTEALLKHPLLKSAKKGNFLMEKLVVRCPPITARNIHLAGAQNVANQNASNPIEWDFSDNEANPLNKKNDGNVSRKGRFIVQAEGANACEAEEVIKDIAGLSLQDHPANSTIRKGRFSVECPPKNSDALQSASSSSWVGVPVTQFEQLCLLVDMLKEHVDSIGSMNRTAIPYHSQFHGGHRRSSTSLGKTTRRESTETSGLLTDDRRDSLQ